MILQNWRVCLKRNILLPGEQQRSSATWSGPWWAGGGGVNWRSHVSKCYAVHEGEEHMWLMYCTVYCIVFSRYEDIAYSPFLLSSCMKCSAGIGVGFTHFHGTKWHQKLANFATSVSVSYNFTWMSYILSRHSVVFKHQFVDALFLRMPTSRWCQWH